MNGYTLTRQWFNFTFETSEKVNHSHTAMYFYIIDLWNRLGQKKEFGIPTSITMEALRIGSYNTYKKVLNDLIDWGFIKSVSESKNQHQARVIALSKYDKATDKALDKATAKATNEPTDKATDTIIEQENKGTKEQLKKYIKSESKRMQIEKLMRAYSLPEFNYDEKVDLFFEKLIAEGEIDKPNEKIEYHFPNWLRAELGKEKKGFGQKKKRANEFEKVEMPSGENY